MSHVERAVDYVKGRGYARTPELAKHLGMIPGDVDLLLAGQSVFVTCDVQVGESKLKEYRLSSSPAHNFRAGQPVPPTPPGQASVVPTPIAHVPPAPVREAPKENVMATIRTKIEAALRAHGPMDSRAMRKHGLKDATLSQHLGDLADRKVLERLGGGPRSTVYGLPGQKLNEKAEPKLRQRDALASGGELGRRTNSDSPYADVLKDLEEKRAAKLSEIAKLEGAIEAVRALAA